MGMTDPAATLTEQARQNMSIDTVLGERYGIPLQENSIGTNMHCRCPLPGHPSYNKAQTFRIYPLYPGARAWNLWRCLSKTCTANRAVPGSDVVALVANLERCTPNEAIARLREWETTLRPSPAEV